MKRKFLLIVAIVGLLFLPVMAGADDLMAPDWRGGDLSIFAHWNDFNDITGLLLEPDIFTSIPATTSPYIDITDSGFGVADKIGGKILFNTSELASPVLTIKANNFNNDNPLKRIRLQLTYDWNRSLESVKATGQPNDSVEVKFLEKNKLIAPTVYFSAIDIFMQPNPFFEQIDLTFGGGCNLTIDQIVFDTQCVPQTPIPGSVLLLGSGIIGMVGVGLRRKSS